jgi:hypothetical protein
MILGLFALLLLFAGVMGVAIGVMELSSRLPRWLPAPLPGAGTMWLIGMLLIAGLLMGEDLALSGVQWAFEADRDIRQPSSVVGPAGGFLAAFLAIPFLYGLKFFVCSVVVLTLSREYKLPKGKVWFGCLISFYALYLTAAWLAWSGVLGRTNWGFYDRFFWGAPLFLVPYHLVNWGVVAWLWRGA